MLKRPVTRLTKGRETMNGSTDIFVEFTYLFLYLSTGYYFSVAAIKYSETHIIKNILNQTNTHTLKNTNADTHKHKINYNHIPQAQTQNNNTNKQAQMHAWLLHKQNLETTPSGYSQGATTLVHDLQMIHFVFMKA